MKRLAVIAAVLLALVVTASAVVEAWRELAPRPPQAAATPRSTVERYQSPVSRRTAVVGALVAAQRTVTGTASWYCGKVCTNGYPAGSMVAAAGSELRSEGWRGSWVTVSHGGRSVRVQLVDWCGCPGSRVVDLYGEPFSRLADTSAGVIGVQVTRGLAVAARPTLPATDR